MAPSTPGAGWLGDPARVMFAERSDDRTDLSSMERVAKADMKNIDKEVLFILLKPRSFLFVFFFLSMGVFFREQICSGFANIIGDRYDGFIETSIQEHWYNVLKGWSSPFYTEYFYPYRNTLGYNDGYFLYGLVYSAIRWCGFDPFISGEIVNIVVRGSGFVGFYAAGRIIFSLSPRWAAFGAALFTISNN